MNSAPDRAGRPRQHFQPVPQQRSRTSFVDQGVMSMQATTEKIWLTIR